MLRAILISALFCCATAAKIVAHAQSVSPSTSPTPAFRIDAKAVWNPSPSVLSDIRKVCSAGDPAQQQACFVDSMRSAGASAEAAGFVKAFASHGLAYVRAFRDTGRVSIAYIEYLFRANEMDGVLLVNGTPPMIDVDDYKYLSQEDLRTNGDYAALLQKYPNVSVFPGDRYHTEKPTYGFWPHGFEEFEFEYLLLDGCHACTRIGTLVVGFDFDESGRFSKARVLKVRPGGDADYERPDLQKRLDPIGADVTPTDVRCTVGASFTIPLPANHTTGYSWRLAKAPSPDILKQGGETYSQDDSGLAGAGGKEMWSFEGMGPGTVELEFEYARPFEKNAAPLRIAKYKVEVQ
jgi:predicted secreted protein